MDGTDTSTLTDTVSTVSGLDCARTEAAWAQYGRNTSDDPAEDRAQADEHIQMPAGQIDLDAVEQLLRKHVSVDDAAVVHRDGADAGIVGFITLHGDAIECQIESQRQSGDDYETQQTQLWETVFDRGTYTAVGEKVRAEAVGRDFTGWVSAYNGRPLHHEDMNEWLDDTIEMVLGCGNGRSLHVLEIGTGSGMIFFNIASSIQSYLGLEPSRTAVEFVTATTRSMPDLANQVQIHQGTATDLHLLGSTDSNVVVINSVAQYFPSRAYLLNVLKAILQIASVRTIFFGDVRSYALQKDFLLSRAVYNLGEKASKNEVRDQMAEMAQAELELLVDPAFFTSLPDCFPNLVEHVQILPKRMKADNELSSYRYAAIIHVKSRQPIGEVRQQILREVKDEEWIDFIDHRLDRQTLLHRLEVSTPITLAVSNIPYSKTIFERHAIDSLDDRSTDNDLDWLSSARERSQGCPSLSALDLLSISRETGYQVEISWARQHSQRGGLDAIFHRYQPPSGGKVLFRFPTDHQGRAPQTFSNQPLRQQAEQSIQQQLYETLDAQLPSHLVPDELVVLPKLPINVKGELDRQALAKRA
ncbi:MAG: hypothetical protein Q9211_000196 [Gyalolechia sp. 1 TL-2023]